MYSLLGYEEMIDDKVRMDAYVAAIKQAIRPGCVVLEIGAGTGMMSMLACQFGARHVYSIEPDNAIAVAREHAQANGLADRITFIQDLSTRIELPEKADVIISDLRGVLPLFTTHIESIIHARQNHLASEGVMIPQQDKLHVAVTESPREKAGKTPKWDRNLTGLDLSSVDKYLANTWNKIRVEADSLLSAPVCWATLDYRNIESPDVAGKVELVCTRSGTARGLMVWFDTQLLDGIGFSNAPGKPPAIYGRQYIPLLQVTDVCTGDTVEVKLEANPHEEDYIWQWQTRIHRPAEDRLIAEFNQSNFHAAPLSLADLQKGSDQHVPQLNEEGQVDLFILGQMGGHLSLGEIASKLAAEFPDRFDSPTVALNRVAKLSKNFSR